MPFALNQDKRQIIHLGNIEHLLNACLSHYDADRLGTLSFTYLCFVKRSLAVQTKFRALEKTEGINEIVSAVSAGYKLYPKLR